MTNQEFLNNVVKGMNKGYYISPSGKDKLIPLHGTIGSMIRKELGDGYEYYGYGDGHDDKEHVIKNGNIKYNADCVFEKFDEKDFSVKSKCGVIECKTFFSSGKKNIMNNIVASCNSCAAKVRPLGYNFGFFFITQDRLPLFTKDEKINGFECVGKNVINKMMALSDIPLCENNASELLFLCVYDLPDFDYDSIRNKHDYASALLSYDGPIIFKDIDDMKSTERFIFNDPNRFAKDFASLIKSPKKPVLDETYAKYFLKTPIEDQEEYLIAHGLIPRIPNYIK